MKNKEVHDNWLLQHVFMYENLQILPLNVLANDVAALEK